MKTTIKILFALIFLLATTAFSAQSTDKPSPVSLTLAKDGELSLDAVRKAKRMGLIAVNGYSVVSYQVIVAPKNGTAFISREPRARLSDGSISRILKSEPGTDLVIDNILLTAKDGSEYKASPIVVKLTP